MLRKLPQPFVKKVAKELLPLYQITGLGGSKSSPTIEEVEELIEEVYHEFVKTIEANPDDYCVETSGLEIREETGEQISISFKRSFYIDKDGDHAIY